MITTHKITDLTFAFILQRTFVPLSTTINFQVFLYEPFHAGFYITDFMYDNIK